MATSTVENYIKQIYLQQQESAGELVPMGRLAAAMGVVPGTATAMVKTLADSGLVQYEPREGIRLTRGGNQLALHVLRRHRILELFLVNVLGLSWAEVHEEAEHLEHALSDKVLDRMDALLNYPRFDPHGDPIPTAKGKIEEMELERLTDCPEGEPRRIVRITDQDAPFLQFLEQKGLVPGETVTIVRHDPFAEAVTVRLPNRDTVSLGAGPAAKIMVASAG